MHHNIRRRFIEISGQLKLSLLDGGSGETACILLHGIGEGAYVWENFASQIATDWRVIAFDLPGHGESDWYGPGKYSVEAFSSAVNDALDLLEVGNIVLIGHSLGGEVAIHLCTELASILRGLVLVDTGPDLDTGVIATVANQMRSSRKIYANVDEYENLLKNTRFLASENVIRQQARGSLRPAQGGGFELRTDPSLLELLETDADDERWMSTLKSVRAPTLLVRGQGSAVLTSAQASKMLSVIPNGAIEVVERAGHSVVGDNPEGFLAALKPFLARLRPTPKAVEPI